MGETPMSALTLLCSGIQLYSAEQRIADCILADVKWAASATSAELARQSQASEATVTRLCHKLGFESYRKFQLALARDVMEQQEAEKSHAAAQPDRMRSILQKFLVNKQEEVRATVQALDADQLRAALACLNAAHVVEVAAASHNLSIALEASVKFGSLGKRCVASAIPEKTRAFAATLTKNDLLLVISGTGRNPALEEVARLARENGAAILLITSDRHSPLAQQADHVLLASNREQRLIEGDHAPSQLSVLLVIEVLVHSPTYIGFTRCLENNGYDIVHSPLVQDENGVWRMDFADMEKHLAEEHIHAAILCSPHNPCGRVWGRWELEKAMELFKKYNVYVVSDEIWSDIILSGHKHIPTQSISEDARQRTAAMYAPSKTFNLAGLIGSYHIVYNDWWRDRINKEVQPLPLQLHERPFHARPHWCLQARGL